MKKLISLSIFFVLCLFLASCSITQPYAVTNNKVNAKEGVSSTVCIFSGVMRSQAIGASAYSVLKPSSYGVCFNGKYGVKEAATNGGVKEIGSVDLKITNYMLFSKFELVVTGE